ncbi:hypothetical protein [Alkaliphilus sp. B6464]|uniref:hypothetical protein n=1 Tax=Alkaliphilus sp. B6464 TaxID=2731219 RepID=UPI001BAD8D4F|nr:hypothetical protein [Alkaliphilus sp. B6464]QUH22052.1 hypothetical protein HYG84_19290 [Alkaliphilus sp. B6464]
MKLKKILLIAISLVLVLGVTGCSDSSGAGKRYVQDRSDRMEDIAITDSQYKMGVTSIVTPIIQSGYNININAQQIKMGRGDIMSEIENIERQVEDVQSVRNKVSSLKVLQSKEMDKEDLINGIDTYSQRLNNYKAVLQSENLTKDQVQLAIDNLMAALDIVKQYTR